MKKTGIAPSRINETQYSAGMNTSVVLIRLSETPISSGFKRNCCTSSSAVFAGFLFLGYLWPRLKVLLNYVGV